MIDFSVWVDDTGKVKKLEFTTSNNEFFGEVYRYIKTCADAMSWRNRVEQIVRTKLEEDE